MREADRQKTEKKKLRQTERWRSGGGGGDREEGGEGIEKQRETDNPERLGGCMGQGVALLLPRDPVEGLPGPVTLSQKILIWQTARCTRRSVPEPQS